MPEIVACDISNPLLDPYRNLKQPRHSNRFVAEGRLVVERLLLSRYRTESILVAQRRSLWVEQFVQQSNLDFDGPIYAVPDHQVDDLVGFDFHSGILGIGLRSDPSVSMKQSPQDGAQELQDWLQALKPSLKPALKPSASTTETKQLPSNQTKPEPLERQSQVIAVLPHLDLDENLGSIIRSAWALGCSGLIMDRRGADPLGRRTLRVSMGHSLSMPIFRSQQDLEALIPILKQQRFHLTAVEVHPKMRPLRDAQAANRQALVFGNEFQGVDEAWLSAADEIVGIPMAREVDSLNVAVTVAIVLNHYCVK